MSIIPNFSLKVAKSKMFLSSTLILVINNKLYINYVQLFYSAKIYSVKKTCLLKESL